MCREDHVWKCVYCRDELKLEAHTNLGGNKCQFCGQPWQKVIDPSDVQDGAAAACSAQMERGGGSGDGSSGGGDVGGGSSGSSPEAGTQGSTPGGTASPGRRST
jgi:hypothetical protein